MTPEERAGFAADLKSALQSTEPAIPCKYLYDERGSALFEQICATEEYYVTRADLALHEAHLDEIVDAIGPGAHIIELGSGAGIKIRHILAAAERPRAYTAIEISADALQQSLAALRERFPDLEIHGLKADYTRDIPGETFRLEPEARRRVVYFPGSTISNFTHSDAHAFLCRMANMAGAGGAVLIGVDLAKSPERLERAYDDRDGVTAAFNLNLLHRLRNDLGAQLDPDAWRHRALYNESEQRIEMHLEALKATTIAFDGVERRFEPGQRIHTENSHKYSIESFRALLDGTGLKLSTTWTDPEGLFSMHWLEREE